MHNFGQLRKSLRVFIVFICIPLFYIFVDLSFWKVSLCYWLSSTHFLYILHFGRLRAFSWFCEVSFFSFFRVDLFVFVFISFRFLKINFLILFPFKPCSWIHHCGTIRDFWDLSSIFEAFITFSIFTYFWILETQGVVAEFISNVPFNTRLWTCFRSFLFWDF